MEYSDRRSVLQPTRCSKLRRQHPLTQWRESDQLELGTATIFFHSSAWPKASSVDLAHRCRQPTRHWLILRLLYVGNLLRADRVWPQRSSEYRPSARSERGHARFESSRSSPPPKRHSS